MENMSETTVVVNTGLDTPNGLGVDWIANNIYWTDNDFKVHFNFVEKEYYKYVISVLKNLNNFEILNGHRLWKLLSWMGRLEKR